MPHPTGLAAEIRPAADFPGVIFARSWCHAKDERRPAEMRLNEQTRTFAMKAEMKTTTKKKPIAVRLEFHDDRAKSVCIVGTTMPMLTIGPGQWIKELTLSPGIYEYQYVVDGRWINDPHAVKSTPNPFGGRNSVLVVEQNNTKSGTTSSRVTPCAKLPEKRRQS
jgi:hypothetical protein